MKQTADQQIDAVLAGLRDAAPPKEMEQRILQKLDQRAKSAPSWRTLLICWTRPLPLFATAAAICALVALAIHPRQITLPAPAVTEIAATQPALPIPHKIAPQHTVPAQPGITAPPKITPAASPRPLRYDTNKTEEQRAIDDMNAPSMPAPELPLTAEEREMRKMVRQAPPNELAALHPAPQKTIPEANIRAFFSGFTQPTNDGELPQ